MQLVQARLEQQDRKIEAILSQLDDYENRSLWKNINLPVTINTPDLIPTLLTIFDKALDRPLQHPMEIECVHRALAPLNPDVHKQRDVIFKLLHFQNKDATMKGMRSRSHLNFEGMKIYFFPDLLHQTLALHKDVCPLLEALKHEGAMF